MAQRHTLPPGFSHSRQSPHAGAFRWADLCHRKACFVTCLTRILHLRWCQLGCPISPGAFARRCGISIAKSPPPLLFPGIHIFRQRMGHLTGLAAEEAPSCALNHILDELTPNTLSLPSCTSSGG